MGSFHVIIDTCLVPYQITLAMLTQSESVAHRSRSRSRSIFVLICLEFVDVLFVLVGGRPVSAVPGRLPVVLQAQ